MFGSQSLRNSAQGPLWLCTVQYNLDWPGSRAQLKRVPKRYAHLLKHVSVMSWARGCALSVFQPGRVIASA
jgi:hypothetical protein